MTTNDLRFILQVIRDAAGCRGGAGRCALRAVPARCDCGDTECGRCFPFAEKCLENAAEEALERLDRETDRVFAEVLAGDHCSDLCDAPQMDRSTITKIAIERAYKTKMIAGEYDQSAINNFKLQILDYCKDVAERRLL